MRKPGLSAYDSALQRGLAVRDLDGGKATQWEKWRRWRGVGLIGRAPRPRPRGFLPEAPLAAVEEVAAIAELVRRSPRNLDHVGMLAAAEGLPIKPAAVKDALRDYFENHVEPRAHEPVGMSEDRLRRQNEHSVVMAGLNSDADRERFMKEQTGGPRSARRRRDTEALLERRQRVWQGKEQKWSAPWADIGLVHDRFEATAAEEVVMALQIALEDVRARGLNENEVPDHALELIARAGPGNVSTAALLIRSTNDA